MFHSETAGGNATTYLCRIPSKPHIWFFVWTVCSSILLSATGAIVAKCCFFLRRDQCPPESPVFAPVQCATCNISRLSSLLRPESFVLLSFDILKLLILSFKLLSKLFAFFFYQNETVLAGVVPPLTVGSACFGYAFRCFRPTIWKYTCQKGVSWSGYRQTHNIQWY